MARILQTTDRITLEVDELEVEACSHCAGKGEVAEKVGDVAVDRRCPVCRGLKELPTNRIKGTISFSLSPFSWIQKQDILSKIKMISGTMVIDESQRTFLAVKHSVKGAKGFEVWDDKAQAFVPWTPRFEAGGSLEDSSVEELLNSTLNAPVIEYTKGLVNGIPRFLVSAASGLPMPGVRIKLPGDLPKKA